MALEINDKVSRILGGIKKLPSIVVEFDGITEVFNGSAIYSYVRIGDTGLYIDGSWTIGGTYLNPDQKKLLSFEGGSGGTTTKIDAKIDPDIGIGETVTSMRVAIVDDAKSTFLSLLGSYEFLARKARIKFSPDASNTLYPDDYTTIFRGIVDQIDFNSGIISLNIAHPDSKKRQSIFIQGSDELDGAFGDSDTTITLTSASTFLDAITGPDGSEDAAFESYVKINDEIIKYTGISGSTLTGCTRAQFGTIAAAHNDGDEVNSFYRIQDTAMNIALKFMLSGWNGYFATGQSITNITSDNELYFSGRNLIDEYGLTVGDYLTTVSASNGANNVSLKTISLIEVDSFGNTTITVSDVSFVEELGTSATVSFRSRYDTLPSGLKMTPDEVDVAQHEYLDGSFLSTANMDIYLKETIDNAKDFIAEQLYRPLAAYSVPRETKSSVGYTIPPLPTETPKTLDSSNVKNPEKINKVRSTGRNFYNTVFYIYDEDPLEDKYLRGAYTVSAESKAQISLDAVTFKVESKGLRSGAIITSAADRRLRRYKYAASQISGLKTTFGNGFIVDVGDKILVDGVTLKIPDEAQGTKTSNVKLYEVIRKSIDLKTGDVSFVVLDTNFNLNYRYGLISPSSIIQSVTDAKTFTIAQSYNWNSFEYKKWQRYEGSTVRIRTTDYASAATGIIDSADSDTIVLQSNLSITPSANMIMELSDYNDANDTIKLLYVFLASASGTGTFNDGKDAYRMI